MTLLALLLAIYNAYNAPAPQCAITVQPKLSLAPLRAVRLKAVVEAREDGELWRSARVCLVDAGGEITCHGLWEGDAAATAPRTTWVNLEIPPQPSGEYAVVLQVESRVGSCQAVDKLTVHGEGQ